MDVLEPAEEPKGVKVYILWILPPQLLSVTLQAAAGFNIHLFPTGQGQLVIQLNLLLNLQQLTVKEWVTYRL